jgi:hypothetical protein
LSQVETVTAALSQRLLKKLTLDISGGYTSTTYQQTSALPVPASNYDTTSFNVRLSTIVLRRVSTSVFFQQNFVSSNANGVNANLYNYTTWQAGLSLGYRW